MFDPKVGATAETAGSDNLAAYTSPSIIHAANAIAPITSTERDATENGKILMAFNGFLTRGVLTDPSAVKSPHHLDEGTLAAFQQD